MRDEITLKFNKIDFSFDNKERKATGVVVPFDIEASDREISIDRNALNFGSKKEILSFVEHQTDPNNLIGSFKDFEINEEGVKATLYFKETNLANNAIEMIKADFYRGFSVGLDNVKFDKEGSVITKANVKEVSLVSSPAFKDAKIDTLVASKENKIDCKTWIDLSSQEKLNTLRASFSNKLSNIMFNAIIGEDNPEGSEELESLKEKLSDYENMKEKINEYEIVIEKMQSTLTRQNEFIKSIKG